MSCQQWLAKLSVGMMWRGRVDNLLNPLSVNVEARRQVVHDGVLWVDSNKAAEADGKTGR